MADNEAAPRRCKTWGSLRCAEIRFVHHDLLAPCTSSIAVTYRLPDISTKWQAGSSVLDTIRCVTVARGSMRVINHASAHQDMTSPVMTKIGAAFLYSKAAFMAPADQPLLPMSKVVKGASGDLRCSVGWGASNVAQQLRGQVSNVPTSEPSAKAVHKGLHDRAFVPVLRLMS